MKIGRCSGCEAKDQEISRLWAKVDTLLNRLMLATGRPEAVLAPDEPEGVETLDDNVPASPDTLAEREAREMDKINKGLREAMERAASESGLPIQGYDD